MDYVRVDQPRSLEEVARLLNTERVRQNLSISAAARIAQVPKATVQGWLNGRHLPTPALRPHFDLLVSALGLSEQVGAWPQVAPAVAALRDTAPPYVGLRPFGVGDANRFFGQTDEVQRIAHAVADKLGQGGIIAVVGPSGCGKSSILAAGVLGRACAAGGVLEGRRGLLLTTDELPTITTTASIDFVVVDQFEDALDSGEPLADCLAAVARIAETHPVLIGIRSDAFGPLADQPLLHDALEHPILVAPMSRAGAVAAIERPAAQRGVLVEPGLAPLMISDLAGPSAAKVPAGVLPLLSNALLMTWSVGRGRQMTIADYELTGGIGSAIEAMAEGVLTTLSTQAAEHARPLMLKLVRVTEAGVLRIRLSLTAIGEAEREVSQALIQARILTATADYLVISHESLFRYWPRLAQWIEQSRDELRARDHLERATQLWIESGRSPDSLLAVDRLPVFLPLLDADSTSIIVGSNEREFLTASREHFTNQLDQERSRSARLRRRGQISFVLAAIATSLAVIAGFAVVQTRDLQLDAQSRQVASRADTMRNRDPNLQAQLALVSHGLTGTREGVSALLEATSVDVPTRWPGSDRARLAVDPAGQLATRASEDGTVTLWTAAQVHTSPGSHFTAINGAGSISAVALGSTAGRKLLAIGTTTGSWALWDVTAQPSSVGQWAAGAGTVDALSFSQNGSLVAVGFDDGRLELVSLTDPAHPVALAGLALALPVTALAFDPRRPRLYVGGADDDLGIVDLSSPRPRVISHWAHTPGRKAHALSLSVSPDGHWLVAGVTTSLIVRWDLAASKPVARSFSGVPNYVAAVAFNTDSSQLVAGDLNQKVHLFDAATMAERRVFDGPSEVTGVGFVAGAPVATTGDGMFWAWPAHSPVLRAGGGTIYQLVTDRTTRKWLAAPSPADQNITVWSLRDGIEPAFQVRAPAGVRLSSSAAFSPDGGLLYAGGRNGDVITWPLTDTGPGAPRVQRVFPGKRAADVSNVVVSPSGTLMVTPDYAADTTIVSRIKPDQTITPVATIKTPDSQVATINADDSLLQIGTSEGVQLWDLRVPELPVLVSTVKTSSLATASWFAPHSALLATGTDTGVVSVWDISHPNDPIELHRFTDARAGIYAVTFSADERHLVAAGGDEVFFGWSLDGQSNQASFILEPQMGRTTETRFVLDGAAFIGAGENGEVRAWTLDPEQAQAQLCGERGAALSADEWARYLPGLTPIDPC